MLGIDVDKTMVSIAGQPQAGHRMRSEYLQKLRQDCCTGFIDENVVVICNTSSYFLYMLVV